MTERERNHLVRTAVDIMRARGNTVYVCHGKREDILLCPRCARRLIGASTAPIKPFAAVAMEPYDGERHSPQSGRVVVYAAECTVHKVAWVLRRTAYAEPPLMPRKTKLP